MTTRSDIKAGKDGYLVYYHRPVQSRDKRLWLCYVLDEKQWALSSSPYFPNSKDMGFRWDNRTEGVITLNIVSTHRFGTDKMQAAVDKCKSTMERISLA